MAFLSDILLASGAFAAAIYCLVLSRRLKALTKLDSGMGAAIAVLSVQVDELKAALAGARETAQGMSGRLGAQTERAEAAARRLELLIASLHDLPESDACSTRQAAKQTASRPRAQPASEMPDSLVRHSFTGTARQQDHVTRDDSDFGTTYPQARPMTHGAGPTPEPHASASPRTRVLRRRNPEPVS